MSSGHKIVAGLITVFILGILILSGPVNAYILGFSVLNPEVIRGEEVSFSVTLKDLAQESIDEILLKIGDKECRFDVEGNIISDCFGIQINRTFIEYNYGYGTIKNISYSLKLDTSGFTPGIYATEIQVKSEGEIASQKGSDIVIKDNALESCSVRAKEGILIVEGADFGKNNKINFYIPLENAAPGEGYLIGQKDRTRFSYSFNVDSAKRNGGRIIVNVSGKYRVGIEAQKDASAVIIIENGKIVLNSEEFNIEDMEITYKNGC